MVWGESDFSIALSFHAVEEKEKRVTSTMEISSCIFFSFFFFFFLFFFSPPILFRGERTKETVLELWQRKNFSTRLNYDVWCNSTNRIGGNWSLARRSKFHGEVNWLRSKLRFCFSNGCLLFSFFLFFFSFDCN